MEIERYITEMKTQLDSCVLKPSGMNEAIVILPLKLIDTEKLYEHWIREAVGLLAKWSEVRVFDPAPPIFKG